MDDFDSPWKEALDHYFESFVSLCLPTVHAAVDWSRGYEMLDKELQQIVPEADEGRRYVDKLAKVWLTSGEEEWLLVHVEVQTQDESDFARRMFVYHTRIRELYHKDVLSVALLADDRPGWKPQVYRYECMGLCRVTFEFPAIKLLELSSDEANLLEKGGPFAVVVIAHLRALRTRKDDKSRQQSKLQLVKNLYEAGLGAEDVRKLFRLIDWLMRLPKALDIELWRSVRDFATEKQMPFVDIAEQMGLEKGRRKTTFELLETALQLKFGQPGLDAAQELAPVMDVDLLQKVFVALLSGRTLAELRAMWTKNA